MTVKELIEKLKQVDENKLVHVEKEGDYVMVKDVAEYEDIVEVLLFNRK